MPRAFYTLLDAWLDLCILRCYIFWPKPLHHACSTLLLSEHSSCNLHCCKVWLLPRAFCTLLLSELGLCILCIVWPLPHASYTLLLWEHTLYILHCCIVWRWPHAWRTLLHWWHDLCILRCCKGFAPRRHELVTCIMLIQDKVTVPVIDYWHSDLHYLVSTCQYELSHLCRKVTSGSPRISSQTPSHMPAQKCTNRTTTINRLRRFRLYSRRGRTAHTTLSSSPKSRLYHFLFRTRPGTEGSLPS